MSLPGFKQCPCCGSAACFGWDVRVEYAPNDVDLFKRYDPDNDELSVYFELSGVKQ